MASNPAFVRSLRVTTAPVDAVWALLADGWTYPSWVVGAARVRAVSADWPSTGAAVAHSVGSWPLLINDRTVVAACRPNRELELRGKARPLGEVHIVFELAATAEGGCTVVMGEDVVSGPTLALPRRFRDVLIRSRNDETLRRLCLLAERQTAVAT